MLLDLRPASSVQGPLFQTPDDPLSQALMKALDVINCIYREGTVVYGSAGLKRGLDMRRGCMSQSCTSSRDDLRKVRDVICSMR